MPMGFWHDFQGGQSTKSDQILKKIMNQQQSGAPTPHNAERMCKDVYDFPQFPEDTAKGHAAWLDWPWKLHRIKDGKTYELYNLEDDSMETIDLSAHPEQRQRIEVMKAALDAWSRSIIRSINGDDYITGGEFRKTRTKNES
jgi:hypothetical protein